MTNTKNNAKQLQKDIFSDEFKKFFKKNIKGKMLELESKRNNYIYGIYGTIIVGIIVEALILLHILKTGSIQDYTLKVMLSIIPIFGIIVTIIIKSYKTKAKNLILPTLLSFIGDFSLVNKSLVEKDLKDYFKEITLIPYFENCYLDDCLKGTYNGIDVGISEVKLTKETGSGKNRKTITVFKGLFVCFQSVKKFKGQTVIKKDEKFSFNKLEKINLEDPVFEKIYDVIGTDQIESRYLITPAFMNRMVELNKKGIGKNLTLSFENNNVNIAIAANKDWFEIPLFKPATDITNYRAILLELISIFSIIDTLKLD